MTETIRCDLSGNFPLIELINLGLFLNGPDFEVQVIPKSRYPAPAGTRGASLAHPMLRASTYLSNGSPCLPDSKDPPKSPASPVQLSFVSAGHVQLSVVAAGSIHFSASRVPPRVHASRAPPRVHASRAPPGVRASRAPPGVHASRVPSSVCSARIYHGRPISLLHRWSQNGHRPGSHLSCLQVP